MALPAKLVITVIRMSMCLSIYLIISVAVERYLAVCRPHHYRGMQGRSSRVIFYLLPAFMVTIVVNATKFFEIRIVDVCIDYTHCGCGIISNYYWLVLIDIINHFIISKYHQPSKMRLNKSYIIYYHLWTWTFVTGEIIQRC